MRQAAPLRVMPSHGAKRSRQLLLLLRPQQNVDGILVPLLLVVVAAPGC